MPRRSSRHPADQKASLETNQMKQQYIVFAALALIGALLFLPDDDLWKVLKKGGSLMLRALLGRFVGSFLPKI